MWPATAYYSQGIEKGNCEIKANVWVDAGCELGLQIVMADQSLNGYEFRINRTSGEGVQIIKITEGKRTEIASAAFAAAITPGQWIRLKGKMETLDYNNWDAGVRLSLYMDNEEIPLVTYTDRQHPTPRGDGYIGIRAVNPAGTLVKVDNITLRRLFSGEVPKSYEMPVWTWEQLATDALLRLERGGNAQFPKKTMIQWLGFAEQELAMKCGEPYWLDRVYELTTSTMLNDLPIWIERVKGVIISGTVTPLLEMNQSEFNFKHPSRARSGSNPTNYVFMGMTDNGEMQYAFYPAPSGSLTLTLYVKGRAGCIADSAMLPLVPPQHVETLIFGALRRGMRYDANRAVVRENDQMWMEGRNAIIRDHKRKTGGGMTMTSDKARREKVGRYPWWRPEATRWP